MLAAVATPRATHKPHSPAAELGDAVRSADMSVVPGDAAPLSGAAVDGRLGEPGTAAGAPGPMGE